MNGLSTNFTSIEQITDQYLRRPSKVSGSVRSTEVTFQEILDSKSESILHFSKHAATRLASRNIQLSDNQMERLTDGAKKASEKGIQESLVVVDQLAFIVSIPNKTVITAMDQTETNENIFTNIDGAVFM